MRAPVALDGVGPYLLLVLMFCASMAFRPLLPVDETRYLSVAWEMLLQRSFLVPTLNFEPYFQKPPLLFWLVDIVWALAGVGRVSAAAMTTAVSALVIWLSARLAAALFPDETGIGRRVAWLVVGSLVFLVYSTLIMFDLMLTACVLAFMLALIRLARTGKAAPALLAGLALGLGVLSKGPVVLIHVAVPVLGYPFWRDRADIPAGRLWRRLALTLAVALAVVLAWLGPALYRMGGDFAHNLVWRQAAGRIAGSVEGAHARPVYFYLLLLPLVAIPWLFGPEYWRAGAWRMPERGTPSRRRVGLLIAWLAGVVAAFSLISGKQPHYLVPLVPLAMILLARLTAAVPERVPRRGAAIMVVLACLSQLVAAHTVFDRYDLTGLAALITANKGADWAFAGRYQGEVNFLARLERPIVEIGKGENAAWLAAHPGGFVIERVDSDAPAGGKVVFRQRVEKGDLVVYAAGS